MRINYKERHRRIRESEVAAWRAAYNFEHDPGLRDSYPTLLRAPIRLICNPLVKDVNQGGILRLAEAFRIEKVFLSVESDRSEDFSGQRGAVVWQPFEFKPASEALEESISAGYHAVALTLTDRAVDLSEFDWPFPLALVIGEERFGVPAEIEKRCEASVAIPLYGIMQSLNVATATAIALHEAIGQFAKSHPEFVPARGASRRLINP